MKSHLKGNIACKKVVNKIKPLKILGQREDEKLALISYDVEEDVEWVYDIDVEETFFEEPEAASYKMYDIPTVLNIIWEDA